MSAPIMSERPKSMTPRKPAMTKTATMTTKVEPKISLRLGQLTFFVSACTSSKKVFAFSTYSRTETSSPLVRAVA